jgi:hypothetical protein
MANDEEGVSAREYARSRNLSVQYVSRLLHHGIVIVLPNGKIDATATDRMRSAKIRARMPVTRMKHERDSYREARTRREIIAAEREQLLLDQLKGTLVNADRIVELTTMAFSNVRVRMRSLARSLPPVLAGRSLGEAEAIIQQAVDGALNSLSTDCLGDTRPSDATREPDGPPES